MKLNIFYCHSHCHSHFHSHFYSHSHLKKQKINNCFNHNHINNCFNHNNNSTV